MKLIRRCSCLTLVLLIGFAASLGAAEIDSGGIRLILHEGIGRFSLYARADASSTDYISLFVDQDPRTSGISLVVNDKIYKLGDSAEFSESSEKPPGTALARVRWSSRTVAVMQEFTPVISPATGRTEGVRLSFRINNRTRSRLSVGMRICLDTYLGEDNLSHFRSDRHPEIRNELTVGASEMIRYWLSPSGAPPHDTGLVCVTSGSEVTTPDKIVFANWKRLSDASWDYRTSSKRNFNLMPYSINDSAVCMYYDPTDIPAMGSREIVVVLGNLPIADYVDQPRSAAADAAQVAPADAAQVAPDDVSERLDRTAAPIDRLQELLDTLSTESTSVDRDLSELDSFIDIVDERLAAGDRISEEELRLMEQILSVIKDKSEGYSGGR